MLDAQLRVYRYPDLCKHGAISVTMEPAAKVGLNWKFVASAWSEVSSQTSHVCHEVTQRVDDRSGFEFAQLFV